MKLLLIGLVLVPFLVDKTLSQKECTTPDLKPGTCVPIRECQFILDLLEWLQKAIFGSFRSESNLRDYLRNAQCSNDDKDKQKKVLVCCQSWKTTNRETTTSTEEPAKYDAVDFRTTTESGRGGYDLERHQSMKLFDMQHCGPVFGDRIINGNKTDVNEFPWMALLEYSEGHSLVFQCGGTLISKRYVLTAAHCVTKLRGNRQLVSVRLGEHDIATDIDCQVFDDNDKVCAAPVQDIEIESVLPHPDFKKGANDIALIRLSKDAIIDIDNVVPICLPANQELQNLVHHQMLVTGWGRTESTKPSNILLKANLPIISIEECDGLYKSKLKSYYIPIEKNHICAGGGNADSDSGDSGGPLQAISNLNGARFVQYGIVSFTAHLPFPDNRMPTVYTRVSSYMKWILDNMTE